MVFSAQIDKRAIGRDVRTASHGREADTETAGKVYGSADWVTVLPDLRPAGALAAARQ
jgi:hypothetical protein